MNKDISLKGISRIDAGSTHGWFVRAYRNKKTYSKFFSDSKFKNRDMALSKAIEERNTLKKQISKIKKKPTKRRIVQTDSRNKTGELGVSKSSKKAKNGLYYECYSVSWKPKSGKQKSTSFSIKRYGDSEALKMAIDLRRKMMCQIHGNDFYN